MNYLRSLCLAFSFAMIGGGILRLLSPQKHMKQTLRMVTGLFVVCCIVIPFSRFYHFVSSKEGDEVFSESITSSATPQKAENQSGILADLVIEYTEEAFERSISELLERHSIAFTGVDALMFLQEEKIDQAQIMVFLTQEQLVRKDEVYRLITSEYPQNVEVIVKTEESDETIA